MDHPLDARVERKTNIFDLFSLKGKKAMVTKAADGIGKSSAMAFAEAGADLALLGDERDSDQLERLAEELEERFDVKVAVFCCNNLEDEQLDALREELPSPQPNRMWRRVRIHSVRCRTPPMTQPKQRFRNMRGCWPHFPHVRGSG